MIKYEFEKWNVTESSFVVENCYMNETIFALSNGFIGTRGTFVESKLDEKYGIEGNFINGFYESEIIKYGEKGFAYPDVSQTMLNVPNAKIMSIEIDGECVELKEENVVNHNRTLDIKSGCVVRKTTYKLASGKEFVLETIQFVSMTRKNLMAIRLTVTPLNFDGNICVKSIINGDVVNSTEKTNARIDYGPYGRVLNNVAKATEGNLSLIEQETENTKFHLVTAQLNMVCCAESTSTYSKEYEEGQVLNYVAKKNEAIKIDKVICYTASTDMPEADLQVEAKNMLAEAEKLGFDGLLGEQKAFYGDFWACADIEIKGDDALQQGLRFNMFHLLQGAGRDGKTNIGAKCLTGEGYEGHCFWDTEMYALPFFLYNYPEVAKKFIEFRYNTLPQARNRAIEMGSKNGALFPWRTINGNEASPYYPAGTAQYHINADVAFGVHNYIETTGDNELLCNMGAEILIETARFWLDFGTYVPANGNKFCLNCVTGPDEYTAIVNNNCYTNMMAQQNLYFACEAYETLKVKFPECFAKLVEKIGVTEEEIAEIKHAADNMYIPYDEESGIYSQDDSFLKKAEFDIKSVPADKLPIADNFHFLYLYRHQVLKQADTLLAMVVLNENFDTETIKKNYDFYEPKTIHESSLSQCIHSILASLIGYKEKAYEFFISSARLDLDDVQGNTHAGIHMANLAGAWMGIVNGFGRMRKYHGTLKFDPYLPEGWEGYSFKVSLRESLIQVNVDNNGTKFELLKGEPITVYLGNTALEVK